MRFLTNETTPSIAAIAATVAAPPDMQTLELKLRELRTEREATQVEIESLAACGHGRIASPEDDMHQAAARRDKLDSQISDIRKALRPLREAYGLAVTRALEDPRRLAATSSLEALGRLRDGLAILDEIAGLICKSGGQASTFDPPGLGLLELNLRRAAGLQ